MKHQNLQIRTKQFALQVIKFCEGLPKDETSKILARQLLRSGTSVGANYRADESGYWVELLVDASKVDPQPAAPLLNEAKELVAIAISSINTAKRNSGSEE